MIGLPPTPEQVKAFVADPSPQAWPNLIEQLLKSKQYGERWGRHWLDVSRYADSGGYETDIYLRYAWRYRDYVIKSFNDDKPYDVFVQEQIAGDELRALIDVGLFYRRVSNQDARIHFCVHLVEIGGLVQGQGFIPVILELCDTVQ